MSSGTTREDLYGRHFPEALAALSAIQQREIMPSPMIDIGSGGGLPGIVVKIARPDIGATLLEATRKKADFLDEAVRNLELDGATVVAERAENAGRDELHRAAYRLVIARAVAPLPALLELALPFLSAGGMLVAMKGSEAKAEVAASARALKELGGEVEDVVIPAAALPNPFALVFVRKVADTPANYPRRPGIPAKRPL
jgi:16S rRNA (guanine527-N7)-methyltransferase